MSKIMYLEGVVLENGRCVHIYARGQRPEK